MKLSLTQSMTELHTWGGLVLGWLLVPIFLLGSFAVFEPEIRHWMQPELITHRAMRSQTELLAFADDYLRQHAPAGSTWHVGLPSTREPVLEVSWDAGRQAGIEHHFDPLTLRALPAPRETEGGHFFTHFHAELDAGEIGLYLVALAGMVMLAAMISGIIIHKKIFTDFFTFRPKSSPQRSWLDAHNASGVLTLPFLLMIAYTGVAISFAALVPVGTQVLFGGDGSKPRASVVRSFDRPAAGAPAQPRSLTQFLGPAEALLGAGTITSFTVTHSMDRAAVVEASRGFNDRLSAVADHVAFDGVTAEPVGQQLDWNFAAYSYRVMVGLHVARFGGYPVQALYLLLGLVGTIMMAAGLVVFSEKRATQKHSPAVARFYEVVAGINVAVTAGVLIASAIYMWANRLIPADFADRATWEVRAFFIAWLLTFLHALTTAQRRAWIQQLVCGAALCALLPVLNAVVTPNAALPAAIARGEWIRAGVDIGALAIAILPAVAALLLVRRPSKQQMRHTAVSSSST